MNALILNSETISKLFLMKALTFFNFKETVIYSLSKNLYLEQLNISYIEIKKTDNINYDDYDLVICDYQNYLHIKKIYNNKIIFNYDDKIIDYLTDYDSNNICLDVNSDLLGRWGSPFK